MLLFLLLLYSSTCSTIVSCNISISGTFKSYIEDEYKRTNLMPRVSVQLILTLKLPGSADMTEKITHLLSLFRQPSWSACTAVLYGKQLRREQAELNINQLKLRFWHGGWWVHRWFSWQIDFVDRVNYGNYSIVETTVLLSLHSSIEIYILYTSSV